MKKQVVKTSVSMFSILSLVTAVVFCCCTEQVLASVAPTTKHALPACHAQKKQTASPVKSNCSCCSIKKLNAENITKNLVVAPDISTGSMALSHAVFSYHVIKQKYNLAYLDGPPGLSNVVPLYILHHSIRC